MINVVFNYNQNKIAIQSNAEEKMRDICQRFATKVEINVDSKIYLSNGKCLSINPKTNLTLGKQVTLKDTNDIQILVLDDPDKEYFITLEYNGEVKKISSKEADNLSIAYKLFNAGKRKFYALYNGLIVNDMNQSFSQLANQVSKDNNEIKIVLQRDSFGGENEGEENAEGNIPEKMEQLNVKEPLKEGDDNNTEKPEKIIIRNSREAGAFLFKVYLILLIQFLCIGFLTWLGLHFNFNEIINDSLKSMLWTFIPLTLFIFIITSMVFGYEEEGIGKKCLSFNIFIFIPCMTIYCLLLFKFVEPKYMITILSLILCDFLTIIIFYILFQRYKGYLFLLFTLIFNTICMLIFYYYLKYIETKTEITVISLIGLAIFLYTLIFNSISRKKFENYELIATVYFFDYCIFVPAFCIFIAGLLLGFFGIFIGILIGVFAIMLVIFIIMIFFESLK